MAAKSDKDKKSPEKKDTTRAQEPSKKASPKSKKPADEEDEDRKSVV